MFGSNQQVRDRETTKNLLLVVFILSNLGVLLAALYIKAGHKEAVTTMVVALSMGLAAAGGSLELFLIGRFSKYGRARRHVEWVFRRETWNCRRSQYELVTDKLKQLAQVVNCLEAIDYGGSRTLRKEFKDLFDAAKTLEILGEHEKMGNFFPKKKPKPVVETSGSMSLLGEENVFGPAK